MVFKCKQAVHCSAYFNNRKIPFPKNCKNDFPPRQRIHYCYKSSSCLKQTSKYPFRLAACMSAGNSLYRRCSKIPFTWVRMSLNSWENCWSNLSILYISLSCSDSCTLSASDAYDIISFTAPSEMRSCLRMGLGDVIYFVEERIGMEIYTAKFTRPLRGLLR